MVEMMQWHFFLLEKVLEYEYDFNKETEAWKRMVWSVMMDSLYN